MHYYSIPFKRMKRLGVNLKKPIKIAKLIETVEKELIQQMNTKSGIK